MSESEDPNELKEYGFKLPKPDNWLEPDGVWNYFVRYSPELGVNIPHTAMDWMNEVRAIELARSVPQEVKRLFEVARSCIIYGFLCYPLLTLGSEQLYRILETATRLKAGELGCPKKKRRDGTEELAGFRASINWLREKGVISEQDLPRWEASNSLRNHASHPAMQTIYMPHDAMTGLKLTADRISYLFR